MPPFQDQIAKDLAAINAERGEAVTWDGTEYSGVVEHQPMAGLDHYDSLARDRCRLLVLAAGFPRPFHGSSHQFNGARWEVKVVRDLPGTLDILLERMMA